MGLLQKIAIVPRGVDISISDLTRVATAISKQVTRDFRPIWNVDAVVDAAAQLEDLDVDVWPIIVTTVPRGGGYHTNREDGQPFALVNFDADWPLTASHECLEMLADPFGNRLQAGNLLDQAVTLGLPPARVRYLVEVCDPSESAEFAYTVNDVTVSDFYTQEFFDPVAAPGVRYGFTGAITGPRQVLRGGYISWQDLETGHWMQLRMFRDEFSNDVPHFLDLTEKFGLTEMLKTMSVREAIDFVTKPPPLAQGMTPLTRSAARSTHVINDKARVARARRILADMAPFVQAAVDGSGLTPSTPEVAPAPFAAPEPAPEPAPTSTRSAKPARAPKSPKPAKPARRPRGG